MPSRLRSAVTGLLLSTVCLLAHPLAFTVDLLPDANQAGRYTANVQSVHDLSGSIADTFDFVVPVDGFLSFELQAFGPAGSGGFWFQGYQVDGGPIVFNNGPAASLSAGAIPVAGGPGSLLIGGVVAPALPARESVTAGYSGSITVTAIPEPQTWLLMLAGLMVLGRAVARQRSAAHRTGG
jgi:peptidoglycan hydrolase-like protein with peptidoglycan-binding domain